MERLIQLKRKYDSMHAAHARLEEAVELMKQFNNPSQPMYEVVRDSAIKRFEFTIDPFWKFLKAYMSEVEGIVMEHPSPKMVYRQAEKVKIIALDEVELVMNMVDDRNIAAHDYDVFAIEHIKDKLPLYCKIIGNILERIKF
jgi:nucleotidyltransferase substrate binding protein (TIGR01987 family)